MGKGRNSCICCGMHCTSLSKPCHRCPSCHFELKQVGFTATYRPRQCLLTSRNTFFRYSELGFRSHTGLNLAHGVIATLSGHYACADATPCTMRREAGAQIPRPGPSWDPNKATCMCLADDLAITSMLQQGQRSSCLFVFKQRAEMVLMVPECRYWGL
jgi:hypothetical protein